MRVLDGAKVRSVGVAHERALVVIKPPAQTRVRRIAKVDANMFQVGTIDERAREDIAGTVIHPDEAKGRAWIDALTVELGKQRG
jgi:hypothetical protein